MPGNADEELNAYGALSSQMVDVSRDDQPRLLSYLDLRSASRGWRRPIVVENAGRPCVHVFDGRDREASVQDIAGWCWRIALRGDGAWVGVLQPGRMRIYRAEVTQAGVVPVEVSSVERGQWALPRFLNDTTAGQNDLARRQYLTRLLERSARDASSFGLSPTDALSLVGRGLFWRFLVDRNLLFGLSPRNVCDTATSWPECLDSKTRALLTFRWLNETFNGGLLPFDAKPREFAAELYSSVLGNIAHGATESGQMRLPTDWQEVNFSYVPVGLLSEVYEAFAHNMDAEEAAQKSIHYTPSHLVEFIVAQALEQLPEGGRPRVLDPAVGAGVFLVTALRQLVEREWREKGERPKRRRIRDILNKQLVGFDTDVRALRLAELALYLTALELDPSPKPLNELQFTELRNNVLFDVSECDNGSLGAVETPFRNAFDLVIGNPPWTAKKGALAKKKAWVENTRRVVLERLGATEANRFNFPDTNMDIPFVWRAMEWAKEGGRIALVTHARWLFGMSDRARQARNDLLRAMRLTGVLNGTALRLTSVWPEVDAPWCVLFATNEVPLPFDRAAFQFMSPTLDVDVDAKQSRIRIDWLEAQTVMAADVVERPWLLKVKFRGNRLAERVFDAMCETGIQLRDHFPASFHNGYQVGGDARREKQTSALHMAEMPDTKDAGTLAFLIDADSLPRFSRKKLLHPRDPSIYLPPLLLVRESIPFDRLVVRASRSDAERISFHASFLGLSLAGLADATSIVRYLQLWFQSSAMVFVELMMDARYGIERDAIYKESLELLPIVPWEALQPAQRRRVAQLSEKMSLDIVPALAEEVDDFIFDTYGLSDIERQTILDTLETGLPSTRSKRRAASIPSTEEQGRFITTLSESLNAVLSASRVRALLRKREDLGWDPWDVLELNMSSEGAWEDVAPPMAAFLEEADVNGASLVLSQASHSTWFIGMLRRYAFWTPSRARMLATDIISERTPS